MKLKLNNLLTRYTINEIKRMAKRDGNCHQLHKNCRCSTTAIKIAYDFGVRQGRGY